METLLRAPRMMMQVASHLPGPALAVFSAVCKATYTVARDDDLWASLALKD